MIDNDYIGGVSPPPGGNKKSSDLKKKVLLKKQPYCTAGFWELGGSSGENIWAGGDFMAPFDKEVLKYRDFLLLI